MKKKHKKQFHDELKQLMDDYVHFVYDVTARYPKVELFGLTSQFRRAALSVILNYIEGYARRRKNVLKNFLEISYGSLKESKYLLQFSYRREYLAEETYNKGLELTDRIGRMLWGTIAKL